MSSLDYSSKNFLGFGKGPQQPRKDYSYNLDEMYGGCGSANGSGQLWEDSLLTGEGVKKKPIRYVLRKSKKGAKARCRAGYSQRKVCVMKGKRTFRKSKSKKAKAAGMTDLF